METIKRRVAIGLFLFMIVFFSPITMIHSFAATTSVKVTLEILWNGVSAEVDGSKYYVTAYSDANYTDVVSTKSIYVEHASTGSVIFDDLSSGTYYFRESDANGNPKSDTANLSITYPSGNRATVSGLTSSSDEYVWITESGEKYHSTNNCGNTNSASAKQVTLARAREKGYEACSICYKGVGDTWITIKNYYTVDPNYGAAKTADESHPFFYGGIAVFCVLIGGTIILRKKHVHE